MSQPELDLSAEKQNIYQLAVFSPDKFPDPSAAQQQLDAANAAASAGNQHQEEISNIYSAVYSGVPVFEIMCRGVAVMRRRSDSYLNATQILKVAGIDKGRRTKILEREIQSGSHEKVQGGYGKYQGTWIPFERGVALANQYHVEHLLAGLFNYPVRSDNTPTKDQVLIKVKAAPRVNKSKIKDEDKSRDKEEKPQKRKKNNELIIPHDSSEEYMMHFYNPYPSGAVGIHQPYIAGPTYHQMQIPMQHHVEPPVERYRASLMAIFMDEDENMIPEIILPNLLSNGDFNIDIELDEYGHTALHWAAALGRVNLLSLLIQKGANAHRVNTNGETALMRAVMVPHNFERLSFPALLKILKESITATDKKSKTVLHHTCLSASTKTCTQSCKYYMECLLEFIQNNGKSSNNIENNMIPNPVSFIDSKEMQQQMNSMVDMVDIFGDTSINIAARIGNKCLVDQLLSAGADTSIPNKVGLRPIDFGYDSAYLAQSAAPQQFHQINSSAPVSDENRKARVVYPSIQTDEETASVMTYSDLSHINDEFRKSSEFRQESQNQLKDLTKELSKVRKQNQIFKEQQNQVPRLMLRIHNLECELNLLHEKEQRNSKIPKISMMDYTTTEASEEHGTDHAYQNLLQQIETIQQLLTESEKREQRLHQELANINGNSGISALKCKKIISLCCNIPLNQVDEFIQPLLKAMESDESELLDIEQVADFMNRLKQKPSQSTA